MRCAERGKAHNLQQNLQQSVDYGPRNGTRHNRHLQFARLGSTCCVRSVGAAEPTAGTSQTKQTVNVDYGMSRCAVRSGRIPAILVGVCARCRAVHSARLRCADGVLLVTFEQVVLQQARRGVRIILARANN